MTKPLLTIAFLASLALIALVARGFPPSSTTHALAVDDTTTPTVTDTAVATATATSTAMATATATSTPGVTSVTLVPVNTTIGCTGSTGITVSAKTASGNVADGTPITFSTTIGSIAPTSSTTSGGGVFATLTGQGTGGTATVTATVLGVSGQAAVSIVCGSQPAQLGFPSASCIGSTANVTFSWSSVPGAQVQWLDLTLADNGFAPGTFLGGGPIDPATTSITWNGLLVGNPHFWRLNALTPNGWVTSATGAFVPCGAPQIRGTTYSCTGAGFAAVTLYWAPSTPPSNWNWLDLTLMNNGFAPGSFLSAGPIPTGQGQLTWTGILVNMTHYWRVNSLFDSGWMGSSTGSFYAAC